MTRDEYRAKREARIDRLRERAEKARAESADAYQRMHESQDLRPMGQPILVGHHSEQRHRAALAREDRLWDKGATEARNATNLDERADAAEQNRAVFADDPDAIDKLKARVEAEEIIHAHMLAANAAIRKFAGNTAAQWAAVLDLGFSPAQAKHVLPTHDCFQGFHLGNHSATIRRLRERIAELEARTTATTTETETEGVRVVEDVDENRLQLFFPGKPAETVRTVLKQHGFRWAPSVGAWQRHLTNAARWAAEQIIAAYTTAEQESPA